MCILLPLHLLVEHSSHHRDGFVEGLGRLQLTFSLIADKMLNNRLMSSFESLGTLIKRLRLRLRD